MSEEASSKPKEISPREKLQIEYNQLCAQLGHIKTQAKFNMKEEKSIEDRIEKIVNKSKNLPAADKPLEVAEESKPQEENTIHVVGSN